MCEYHLLDNLPDHLLKGMSDVCLQLVSKCQHKVVFFLFFFNCESSTESYVLRLIGLHCTRQRPSKVLVGKKKRPCAKMFDNFLIQLL